MHLRFHNVHQMDVVRGLLSDHLTTWVPSDSMLTAFLFGSQAQQAMADIKKPGSFRCLVF
ncbi:hypothetical protein OCL06_06605 [Alteromonas sp. ASW11-19]|uniref:Uncharacterized protein n=1 Tax=Alteromonas salexigens TaxID=2982530 RepID=A0ABT2VP66_9ALTE|nr:hypothetical protein [Alteromonas salexigens]MCU7554263.1 hypothetical protein [Alteromonas salexigens]